MNPHPALRYSTLRIMIFVGVLVLLGLLHIRGLLLLMLAVGISGLVSYTLLSKPRDAMSEAVAARLERRRRMMDATARAEDWIDTPADPHSHPRNGNGMQDGDPHARG